MTLIFVRHFFISSLILVSLVGCVTSGGAPARFTPQNSQEIVLSPFYLSDPTAGGDHAWYMKLKISDKIPVAGFLKPNQMLTDSFTGWITRLNPVAGQALSSSVAVPTAGCAGSVTGQIERQEQGRFEGFLVFSDYSDDCSLVFSGRVPFQGEMDMASGEAQVELSLAQLAASLAEKPLQLAGNLRLSFNLLQSERQLFRAESEMSLSDESGLRFDLSPMSFSWDRRTDVQHSTFEGLVDIPPYGLVRLTTLSPMRMTSRQSKPFEGSLRFMGENDSWIRLLFPKPGLPGFFRIDGSDDLETIGQL